jgi:hypothetical protein
MSQSMFYACLPWAILMVVAFVVARVLIWASGAKMQLARLKSIHRCEEGSVQQLSFVLTLPFFLMTLMLIVQTSHIMIANIFVQYAAFATARSAIVWIPAIYESERANEISTYSEINTEPDPVTGETTTQYRISMNTGSKKTNIISRAAILACMPLGPSRDFGNELSPGWQTKHEALVKLYRGLDPGAFDNPKFEERLQNKLAYTIQNTDIDLTFWHRRNHHERWREPPLDLDFFSSNELGWQDHLTANINYNLSLLPGPVRFFGGRSSDSDSGSGSDGDVDNTGNSYIWVINARATMGIEGQKPIWYIPHTDGGNQ